MTAADFAINWVLANPIVTAVLAGPRTLDQWKGYLSALDHGFDGDDETLLDSLVAPGHASTPGYSDPSYPLTGRPVWLAGRLPLPHDGCRSGTSCRDPSPQPLNIGSAQV